MLRPARIHRVIGAIGWLVSVLLATACVSRPNAVGLRWNEVTDIVRGPLPNVAYASYAYDASTKMILVYGGVTERRDAERSTPEAESDRIDSRDLWALILEPGRVRRHEYESSQANAPTARSEAAGAFDPLGRRFIMFGGYSRERGEVHDDLWSHGIEIGSGSDPQWVEMQPELSRPRGRRGATLTYVPHGKVGQLVLFGGCDEQSEDCLSDVWSLDLASSVWTPLSSALEVPGRFGHLAYYNYARDELVVAGGYSAFRSGNPSELTSEIWALDLSPPCTPCWRRVPLSASGSYPGPNKSPGARAWMASAYDPLSDGVTIFGGIAGQSKSDVKRDVWRLEIDPLGEAVWREVEVVERPRGRLAAVGAWDSEADGRFFLFGGDDSARLLRDVWELGVDQPTPTDTSTPTASASRTPTASHTPTRLPTATPVPRWYVRLPYALNEQWKSGQPTFTTTPTSTATPNIPCADLDPLEWDQEFGGGITLVESTPYHRTLHDQDVDHMWLSLSPNVDYRLRIFDLPIDLKVTVDVFHAEEINSMTPQPFAMHTFVAAPGTRDVVFPFRDTIQTAYIIRISGYQTNLDRQDDCEALSYTVEFTQVHRVFLPVAVGKTPCLTKEVENNDEQGAAIYSTYVLCQNTVIPGLLRGQGSDEDCDDWYQIDVWSQDIATTRTPVINALLTLDRPVGSLTPRLYLYQQGAVAGKQALASSEQKGTHSMELQRQSLIGIVSDKSDVDPNIDVYFLRVVDRRYDKCGGHLDNHYELKWWLSK
jgi:hypothetical protein